jgi:hypothetical protein
VAAAKKDLQMAAARPEATALPAAGVRGEAGIKLRNGNRRENRVRELLDFLAHSCLLFRKFFCLRGK